MKDSLGLCSLGLAQTAVHHVSADLLGPLKLFGVDQVINNQTVVSAGDAIGSAFSTTMTALGAKILPQGQVSEDVHPKASVNNQAEDSNGTATHSLLEASSILPNSKGNIHAISILARIMHDAQINPPTTTNSETELYKVTIEKYGNRIAGHVHAWTVNVLELSEGDEELNRKIEEVAWVVCIIYGVGGWTGRAGGSGGQFNADFFLWVSDFSDMKTFRSLRLSIQDASCYVLYFSSITLCLPFTLF